VTYVPFNDLDREKFSENIFETEGDAEKDSQKLNSFKRTLVSICQEEFQNSCSSATEGIYVEAQDRLKQFKMQKREMTQDEREAKQADMDEFMLKLKLRKLGNIKFVGEVYKQGLISTKIMHKCILHLIAVHDADEKFVAWKERPDEQDLELLCRFIQTIGSTLEAKGQSLDTYFAQLEHLASLKSLDSRIRFHLKDLVDLRANSWQERRATDAPKKLDPKQPVAGAQQSGQMQGKPLTRMKSETSVLPGGKLNAPSSGLSGQALSRQSSDSKATSRPQPGQSLSRASSLQQSRRVERPESPSVTHGATSRPPTSSGAANPGSGKKSKENRPPLGKSVDRHHPQSPSPTPKAQSGEPDAPVGGTPDIPASPSPAPEVDESDVVCTLSEPEVEKRVHSLIDEYLSMRDAEEFAISMRELPVSAAGYFVVRLMNKFLDTPKADVRVKLTDLFELSAPYLEAPGSQEVIESSLKSAECLLALNDACLDCQDVRLCFFVAVTDGFGLTSFFACIGS
jgi:hypothetical protein